MTITDKTEDDLLLDGFFEAARAPVPAPDAALTARVLADAGRELARQGQPAAAAPRAQTGWFGFIGGWPSLSGLAAATAAGVWIGFAPPASLSDVTSAVLGDDLSVSVFSMENLLGTEG
jgi:hypothetical protein